MSELNLPSDFEGTLSRGAELIDVEDSNGDMLVRLVPYGSETELRDGLFESFSPGAVAAAGNAPHRLTLTQEHGGPLVARGTTAQDTAAGFDVVFGFAGTRTAQEARQLAKEGFYRAVSCEFRIQKKFVRADRRSDGLHVTHDRATLYGGAMVATPAYESALVLAARSEQEAEHMAQLEAERLERLAAVQKFIKNPS